VVEVTVAGWRPSCSPPPQPAVPYGELGLLCSDPGSASPPPCPGHVYAIQLSLQPGVQADTEVFI
jgi:hypothetical protein